MTVETEFLFPLTSHDRSPDASAYSDLYVDFAAALIADPKLLGEIPNGAMIVLLPEDAPDDHPTEIEAGLVSLSHGRNVYFRHVTAEERQRWRTFRPERDEPVSNVGTRRQRFNPDGSLAADEVLGPDGEWHPFESEEPTDAGGS
jgi:hypothetical protein